MKRVKSVLIVLVALGLTFSSLGQAGAQGVERGMVRLDNLLGIVSDRGEADFVGNTNRAKQLSRLGLLQALITVKTRTNTDRTSEAIMLLTQLYEGTLEQDGLPKFVRSDSIFFSQVKFELEGIRTELSTP